MQTKFKDIAQYYLGTGLRISDTYDCGRNTDFLGISIDEEMLQFTLNGGDIDWGNITAFKPLLRSLDSLTKSITVKGKTFLPAEALWSVEQKEIEDFEDFGEIPEYWKLQIKCDFNE